MKVSSAKLSFYRQSARKVREVAGVVRGTSVVVAEAQLTHTPRRAGDVILKLLRSAVANALDLNKTLEKKDLFIEEIRVDEGPTLKRYRPRAMGRASRINKRTSHITIAIGAKNIPSADKPKTDKKTVKKTVTKKAEAKKTEVKKVSSKKTTKKKVTAKKTTPKKSSTESK